MKVKQLLEAIEQSELDEGLGQKLGSLATIGALAMAPAASNYLSPNAAINPPAKTQQVKPEPKKGVYYKIGAPYKIKGKVYHPKFNPDYNKVGVASWYGPGFTGKKTANGDIFDTNKMMAASPTLPLPSRVWVTNLENGKKVLVTVTDRGPYARDRLIDLSKAAAEKLGYFKKGTARVRVEYDPEETERYLKHTGLYKQYKQVNKLNKNEE